MQRVLKPREMFGTEMNATLKGGEDQEKWGRLVISPPPKKILLKTITGVPWSYPENSGTVVPSVLVMRRRTESQTD